MRKMAQLPTTSEPPQELPEVGRHGSHKIPGRGLTCLECGAVNPRSSTTCWRCNNQINMDAPPKSKTANAIAGAVHGGVVPATNLLLGGVVTGGALYGAGKLGMLTPPPSPPPSPPTTLGLTTAAKKQFTLPAFMKVGGLSRESAMRVNRTAKEVHRLLRLHLRGK